MICKKCGKEVAETELYCPECGTFLKSDTPIFPTDNTENTNTTETEIQNVVSTEVEQTNLNQEEKNIETTQVPETPQEKEQNENSITTPSQENTENLQQSTTINSNTIECPDCGQKLTTNEKFCSKCGRALTPSEDTNNQKISFSFTKKNLFIIGGIILAIIVIIAIIPSLSKEVNKPDFKKAYENVCDGESYCDLASDGTYLEVDTNPYNRDDYYNYTAANIPKRINEELGLPASLYSKMTNTRALDGAQTATYGNISVRWTYHPDQGLEVLYEYNYN